MVKPRIEHAPSSKARKLGDAAVSLAASAGLILDDWQEYVLRASLRQRDGRWLADTIGVCVPRQNGKGEIILARELAGLFLLNEELIIHSAHLVDTALEGYLRLEQRIFDTPELAKQVKRVARTNGREAIWLKNGSRIRFRSRTAKGGRGFSCNCLILDEAMILGEVAHTALYPMVSAKKAQVWYLGSAVDQQTMEHGVVFSRVREQALAKAPKLAYFEWSLSDEGPDLVEREKLYEPASMQKANPAFGIRISQEQIENELRLMDTRSAAVERYCIGDWAPTDLGLGVIDLQRWNELIDNQSMIAPTEPLVFSFDTRPDRTSSTISVAGKRADGLFHVEVVDRRNGTGWVEDRLLELAARHGATSIVCDAASPAASLVSALEAAGLPVALASARDLADACGVFYDAVEEGTVRHLGTPELHAALRGAAKRPLGDAWAWSRKNSAVDICPLVGVTLALWAASTTRAPEVFAAAW